MAQAASTVDSMEDLERVAVDALASLFDKLAIYIGKVVYEGGCRYNKYTITRITEDEFGISLRLAHADGKRYRYINGADFAALYQDDYVRSPRSQAIYDLVREADDLFIEAGGGALDDTEAAIIAGVIERAAELAIDGVL